MRCQSCSEDKGQTFDIAIPYVCEICQEDRTHCGGYPQVICESCSERLGACVECNRVMVQSEPNTSPY